MYNEDLDHFDLDIGKHGGQKTYKKLFVKKLMREKIVSFTDKGSFLLRIFLGGWVNTFSSSNMAKN